MITSANMRMVARSSPESQWISKLLILNVDRHVGMLAQAAKESGSPMTAAQRLGEQIYYLQEVVDLANSSLSKGDLSEAQQCRARVVLGDALLKCRKQKEAAARLERLSNSIPVRLTWTSYESRKWKPSNLLKTTANGQGGMNCLENHPRSPYLPHLVYFTHKACRHLGKLTQGRDLWRKWGPVLTAGSKAGASVTLPGREEEPPYVVPEGKETDFAMMADRQGFYEGFYQLALGEKEAALQAMLKFNDNLYERINTGETLAMPTKTYFEFQSVPMAQRIDVLHDREAPSLEGMTWVQKNPADENSKIELRIFCDSSRGNNRQNRFLDVAKELEQEFSSEGLSVVWISGILREDRADREIAAMKSLAASKNLGWTFGVQAGQEKGILDRHLVSHGGTLLFIIDKDKKVRWEVMSHVLGQGLTVRSSANFSPRVPEHQTESDDSDISRPYEKLILVAQVKLPAGAAGRDLLQTPGAGFSGRPKEPHPRRQIRLSRPVRTRPHRCSGAGRDLVFCRAGGPLRKTGRLDPEPGGPPRGTDL